VFPHLFTRNIFFTQEDKQTTQMMDFDMAFTLMTWLVLGGFVFGSEVIMSSDDYSETER
jgi:hypothetical protein